ncbi:MULTISPECIES: UBA domain-containing protein [Nocardia]|uniref:hypothetical protein n=1 Tax=Nocardia TaxID=1817 RepID=UPI001300463F|nr:MULTISPECIES: hypothetical protein [Nocardia]
MPVRTSTIVGVVLIALGLVGGCSDTSGTPRPVGSTSVVATSAPSAAPDAVERNLRIRQRLLELGCTTNSCIQAYFACMDGYLSGDACEFYRQHPPG